MAATGTTRRRQRPGTVDEGRCSQPPASTDDAAFGHLPEIECRIELVGREHVHLESDLTYRSTGGERLLGNLGREVVADPGRQSRDHDDVPLHELGCSLRIGLDAL